MTVFNVDYSGQRKECVYRADLPLAGFAFTCCGQGYAYSIVCERLKALGAEEVAPSWMASTDSISTANPPDDEADWLLNEDPVQTLGAADIEISDDLELLLACSRSQSLSSIKVYIENSRPKEISHSPGYTVDSLLEIFAASRAVEEILAALARRCSTRESAFIEIDVPSFNQYACA